MNSDIENKKPLDYNKWLSYQNTLLPEKQQSEYLNYLKKWYLEKSKVNSEIKKTFKQQYIELLKDLSFLFGSTEFDSFLSQLDTSNDEELIFTIPFFAKKLKQVAIVFSKKRESVKQAKLKYNLIGSNSGLEKLLYEYILKGFTKTENNISQVPASKFSSYFPELSSVKNKFYIEIEELHDKNSYLGSDSSVPLESYVEVERISEKIFSKQFEDLTDEEILKLLSTRYLTKISNSFLSNAFVNFLNNDVPNLTSEDLFNQNVLNIYNQIEASKRYMSQPLYGLTAIKLKDLDVFDNYLTLDFNSGNNWFYWPSGSQMLDDSKFNNIYSEIPINESSFVTSGATAGDDYTNSDLIFTDKNGVVEGAWLRGEHKTDPEKIKMTLTVKTGEKKEFIFPYPGIDFSNKTNGFLGYLVDDTDNNLLNILEPKIREKILSDYFTSSLPTSSCDPIYINNTSLVEYGSHADTFSDTADNIIKKPKDYFTSSIYSEGQQGEIEQAYLYKFDKTDLPIKTGLNQIYWPLQTFEDENNISLTVNNKFCLPVYLRDFDISKSMVGAIAGLNFSTADVIYKYNTRNSDPTEAAWLGSPSITRLDMMANSKTIYDFDAVNCAQYIDGPIQASLSMMVKPSEKISFIWMDEDTYADEVFKFFEHSPSCPYLKNFPHNYYNDQDYQNNQPINDLKHWQKCNCKSVNYSPIGHSGDNVFDYNGMADYLFADPDGLGVDFALNSWVDTRGYTAFESPQFSYYKLDESNKSDINVGWGTGEWKTGNGKKMVLKTGRRYTYYRTPLRTITGETPYFVAKYSYKNITGLLGPTDGFDLVIIIDNSRSQSLTLQNTKDAVIKIVDKLLSNNSNIQIGLVEFNSVANRLSFLSNQKDALKLFVSQLQTPTDPDLYNTNILGAFTLAETLLTTKIENASSDEFSGVKNLCSKLNFYILDLATGNNILNAPQTNKPKKILIFSDGVENTIQIDSILSTSDLAKIQIPFEEIEIKNLTNQISELNINLSSVLQEKQQILEEETNSLNELLIQKNKLEEDKNELLSKKSIYEKERRDLNIPTNEKVLNLKSQLDSYNSQINSYNSNLNTNKTELNSLLTTYNNLKPRKRNKAIFLKKKIDYLQNQVTSITNTLNNLKNALVQKSSQYNYENTSFQSSTKVYNQQTGEVNLNLNKINSQINNIDNILLNIQSKITQEINDDPLDEILSLDVLYDDINTNKTILERVLLVEQKNLESKKRIVESNSNNSQISNLVNGTNLLLDFIKDLKKSVQIYSVDIGYKSIESDIMEKFASTFSMYFNLQKFLKDGDGDLNSFIDYISMRIIGSMPVIPVWYKAVRDEYGTWNAKYDDYGNLEVSDMQLRPGDYISYIHKSSVSYFNNENIQTNFSTPTLSFTINSKLDGWSYEANQFSPDYVGEDYGARPFWAKVNVRPNETDNFRKDTISFGGKIKFVDDYLPIQQPDVSSLYFENGNLIEYVRKIPKDLIWKQNITLYNTITGSRWNKLIFSKTFSNLKDVLFKQDLDGVVTPSPEASNLVLESYSTFKPAYYNYYARNAFTYTQGLLNKNRCLESYVVYNTAVLIEPSNPTECLVNTFNPSVATMPLPYNIVSEKEVSHYFLPENLGASFYRGKGYKMSIDNGKINYFKGLSAESTYFDLEKYGPRQRGLTKKDQLSLAKIDEIDNSWMTEPYSSAEKAGVMINVPENQKMTPYQSTYELKNKNDYGVSRQNDQFEFWNPKNPPIWNGTPEHPLTFRKELLLNSFVKRKNELLVGKGKLQNWRNDIFGNDYGLYKPKKPNDIDGMNIWFSARTGSIYQNATSSLEYDIISQDGDLVKLWKDGSKKQRDLIRYFGRPTFKQTSDHQNSSILFNNNEALDVMKNTYEINHSTLTLFVLARFNGFVDEKTNVMLSFGDVLSDNLQKTLDDAALAIALKENRKLSFVFGNISLPQNSSIKLENDDFDVDVTKFHLYELVFDSSMCYSYIDGNLFSKSESPLQEDRIYATKGLWTGSYILGSLASRCEISEIILYNKKFSNREKDDMYSYIRSNYKNIL